MQKEPEFLLALDVSTSTIGIALFEDLGSSGELKLLHHVSPKVKPKPENKMEELFRKVEIFEQEFLHRVDGFIEHLNRTCYTGINGYEFHYALYEKGSSYKKHKDQFKNDSDRKYSLINYLNENWLEENGGKLKLYQEEGVQHVSPNAQTAVFFKSDEMIHEVMVSNRSRMSITGWLKRS